MFEPIIRVTLLAGVLSVVACGSEPAQVNIDAGEALDGAETTSDDAGADEGSDTSSSPDVQDPTDATFPTPDTELPDTYVPLPDTSVADPDAPTGCVLAPPFTWRAGAFSVKEGLVVEAIQPAPGGGLNASLQLYRGPSSDLSSLPIKRTIACTMGATICESSWATLGGRDLSLFSGTISLGFVTSPVSSEVKATLKDLEFRETWCVPTDGGCITTFKPGGACYTVPSAEVDTTVPTGTPCTDVEACGTFGKACAIATSKCVASECTVDADCGTGKACVGQHMPSSDIDGLAANACYARCDPKTTGACGTSAECVRRPGMPPTKGEWICKPLGLGAKGAACSPAAGTNNTGCSAALACMSGLSGTTCAQRCDPLATSPGCPSGQRCMGDACRPPPPSSYVSSAKIGEPCTTAGLPCADDGTAFRGICTGFGTSVCKAACELGTTCSKGACAMGVTSGPVCP